MILKKQRSSVYYFNSSEKYSCYHLGITFSRILNENSISKKDLIFLCIGTDRATGDCLGPILGNKLSLSCSNSYTVFGTLSDPVHAMNLSETIDKIYNTFDNPFIVAADSSLGRKMHIGYSTIEAGLLYPGQGINKKLPAVGNVAITGIVNISDSNDKYLLQTTRLDTVMKLCEHIYTGIKYGMQLSGIESRRPFGINAEYGNLFNTLHCYPAVECPQ